MKKLFKYTLRADRVLCMFLRLSGSRFEMTKSAFFSIVFAHRRFRGFFNLCAITAVGWDQCYWVCWVSSHFLFFSWPSVLLYYNSYDYWKIVITNFCRTFLNKFFIVLHLFPDVSIHLFVFASLTWFKRNLFSLVKFHASNRVHWTEACPLNSS